MDTIDRKSRRKLGLIRFKNFLKRKKGLTAAIIIALIVMNIPNPSPISLGGQTIPLTYNGQLMLALLSAIIVIFVTESLPIGSIVGIVYAWVVFFNILSPDEIVSHFSKDPVWFLIGALMMAQVVKKYNLHKRLLLLILKFVGTNIKFVTFGLITFCSLSAAFMGEHLVTAMMLPIVLIIISSVKGGFRENPHLTKLLLFAIGFGSIIGGIGTPSGGGRNVVMLNLINEISGGSLGYGTWLLMALPITIILIPILTFILLKRWKPEIKNLDNAIKNIKEEMAMSKMRPREWLVVIIFFSVLFLWIFHSELGIGMIAILGATLFLIFDLAEWQDYQEINWNIPMLYFGAVGLGSAMNMVGASKWLAARIVTTIGNILPLSGKVLIVFQTTLMSMFTQVMADGPTAATIGPVLMQTSPLLHIDAITMGVALAIASGFAFLFIIGTPSNAIIYGSGYIKIRDFFTTGILMQIIALITLWLAVFFWWRFLGIGMAL